MIVACATVIALPIGILVAVYTSEFAHGRVRRLLGFVLDVLNGLPSIVIGIFIFGLLVLGHQQSALAGGVALAIIMLPLDRAVDAGGARARAGDAARGELRARRQPLAHRRRR